MRPLIRSKLIHKAFILNMIKLKIDHNWFRPPKITCWIPNNFWFKKFNWFDCTSLEFSINKYEFSRLTCLALASSSLYFVSLCCRASSTVAGGGGAPNRDGSGGGISSGLSGIWIGSSRLNVRTRIGRLGLGWKWNKNK